MFANATFRTRSQTMPVVPTTALVLRDDNDHVFLEVEPDYDPVGQGVWVAGDHAPSLVLEVQDGFHPLAAEPAVLLEFGHAGDRLDQLRLGHPDAEPFGLPADEYVLDQLVEGALA